MRKSMPQAGYKTASRNAGRNFKNAFLKAVKLDDESQHRRVLQKIDKAFSAAARKVEEIRKNAHRLNLMEQVIPPTAFEVKTSREIGLEDLKTMKGFHDLLKTSVMLDSYLGITLSNWNTIEEPKAIRSLSVHIGTNINVPFINGRLTVDTRLEDDETQRDFTTHKSFHFAALAAETDAIRFKQPLKNGLPRKVSAPRRARFKKKAAQKTNTP